MTMRSFRKRPVVIQAMQWDGTDSHEAVEKFLDTVEGIEKYTEQMAEAWGPHTTIFYGINTLEGVMRLSKGDWIIRGVKGEYYPIKPDIFAETYEAV